MHMRKVVLVGTLLTIPLLSSGCGGYTNDNVPTVVIDEAMLAQMSEKEAKRQEKYRELAEAKGETLPETMPDGPSTPGLDKRREAAEKRAAKRK